MAVDAEGKKPITVNPGLDQLSEGDLDALLRLVDSYTSQAPRAWGLVHAAVVDEQVRRANFLRSRCGNPGGCGATAEQHLAIPADVKAQALADGFNSIRAAYLWLQPISGEYTADGCRARALAPVLIALARGFHTAALAAADDIAVKRVAMARSASTN